MEVTIIILIILLIYFFISCRCMKKIQTKEGYDNPVVLGLKYPKVPSYADFTWAPYSGYNYDVHLKYFYGDQN